ncbi:MAG: Hpt domain-containing protein [Betaproteobacteria bacterium]|nr:Hpt domain-containing protein [Betaproteobacteria bacterium]
MTPLKPDEPPDISAEARELVGLFLATRRADLARLDAALATGDLETIRAVGHIFRGSSDAFGFPEAGQLGTQLEEAAARGDLEDARGLALLLHAALAAPGSGGT